MFADDVCSSVAPPAAADDDDALVTDDNEEHDHGYPLLHELNSLCVFHCTGGGYFSSPASSFCNTNRETGYVSFLAD